MPEIEKRPREFARDYLLAEANKARAIEMGIPEAAKRHAATMKAIWASIPESFIGMVKSHITSERNRK